jgi:hypothetical protein
VVELLGVELSPQTRAVTSTARVGLVAQAIIYLTLAWLTAEIAAGRRSPQANQQGALAEIVSQPGGVALVVALIVGFACYSLWRLSEAIFGSSANHTTVDRLLSLVRALTYGVFCVSTILFLSGRRGQGDGQQQATWTGRLLRHAGGQIAVAVIGIVVVLVGLGMLVEAALRRFERQLDRRAIPETVRPIVVALGMSGSFARGFIVVLAGALIIDAAVTVNPQQSTGLDGALRSLAGTSFGPLLLGAVAVGFAAFGLYAAATARWIKN